MLITNLKKDYVNNKGRRCSALNGLSADIPDKGITFILGKSGCGKSTLLNIIGCLDNADTGSIVINDVNITNMSDAEKDIFRANNIGFVFQSYNLFDQLNVYENIVFNNRNIGKEYEDKVDRVLKKLGIYESKKKKINELSGGEQQRVAIARAILRDCKILLADEPTGNLDNANSKLIFETLKEFSSDKLVLIVTHDSENAYKYADNIININDGMVVNVVKQKNIEKDDCKVKIDTKIKKTKTSFKSNFNLSINFMIKKKAKMILNILLLTVALALVGVTFMCYNFNFGETASDVIDSTNNNFMSIFKGYNNEKTKKFVITEMQRSINDNTVNELVEKFSLENVEDVYTIYGMTFSAKQSGNFYHRNSVNYAVGSSEIGLDKYGYSIRYGYYAVEKNDVTVTDFLANSIALQNPMLIANILNILVVEFQHVINDDELLINALNNIDENILKALFTENWEAEIKKVETLNYLRRNLGILFMGQELFFGTNKYYVSGIINTNYQENYKDIIDGNSTDQKLMQQFQQFAFILGNSFFVSSKHVADFYNGNAIKIGDKLIQNYSTFALKDAFKPLADNEMLMSKNLFRKTFNEEYNSNKAECYYYSNSLSLQSEDKSFEEVIYEGELKKIVGVFDADVDASFAVILSDNHFEDYQKNMTYRCNINFSKPLDKGLIANMINDLRKKDMAYNDYLTYHVYEIADIMEIFKLIFGIISGILSMLSIILMYNYFSMMIQGQKKEIGIMRALGMSNKNIMYIYLLSSIILISFTLVASLILMSVLAIACNSIIVDKIVWYMNASALSNITILKFNLLAFILPMIIGILVTIVSIMYPIIRIRKMKPIDAIRNE